jgi:hypothetical protein
MGAVGIFNQEPSSMNNAINDSDSSNTEDLGFTWRRRKNGEVEIRHRGRLASTLRGTDASEFEADADSGTFADVQQLMARITGNYKRGNERVATNHPRNKK